MMAGLEITDPVQLHVALASPEIIPGDTLYLRGGNYTIGDLTVALQGTSEAHITIRPYESEPATIVPITGQRCFYIEGAHLDFLGLTLDASNCEIEAVKITDGADNVVLDSLDISNAGRHGVLVTHSTNITIQDCTIYDNGADDLDHQIYVSQQAFDVSILRNIIYGGFGYGVHIYGGEQADVNLIERNYIHDQPRAGIGLFHGQNTVRNNVVRGCLRGIAVDYSSKAAYLYHNTMTDITQYCLHSSTPTIANTIDAINNVFDSAEIGVQALNTKAANQTLTLKNNLYSRLDADVNIALNVNTLRNGEISESVLPITDNGSQFQPTVGSPAIGAGLTGYAADDYAGIARANPPTIGAWE